MSEAYTLKRVKWFFNKYFKKTVGWGTDPVKVIFIWSY